jgi:hypothetical protein
VDSNRRLPRCENESPQPCEQDLREFTASRLRQHAAARGRMRQDAEFQTRPFAPVERASGGQLIRVKNPIDSPRSDPLAR